MLTPPALDAAVALDEDELELLDELLPQAVTPMAAVATRASQVADRTVLWDKTRISSDRGTIGAKNM